MHQGPTREAKVEEGRQSRDSEPRGSSARVNSKSEANAWRPTGQEVVGYKLERGARVAIYAESRKAVVGLPSMPLMAGTAPTEKRESVPVSSTHTGSVASAVGIDEPRAQRPATDHSNLDQMSHRSTRKIMDEGDGGDQCCNCGDVVIHEENMFVCVGVSETWQAPCEHVMCEPCVQVLSGTGPRVEFCDCAHVLNAETGLPIGLPEEEGDRSGLTGTPAAGNTFENSMLRCFQSIEKTLSEKTVRNLDNGLCLK